MPATSSAAKTLGITDENGTGNNGRNNILTNSGAGMCLNLEQKNGTAGVKFVVKNCTFIGENDETLPVYGNKYNGKGSVDDKYKKARPCNSSQRHKRRRNSGCSRFHDRRGAAQ